MLSPPQKDKTYETGPTPAQRDPLVRRGYADSQGWRPLPAMAQSTSSAASAFGERGYSSILETTYLGFVVVNQLDHLLHHVLTHLAQNTSLRLDHVLLLKGEDSTLMLRSSPHPGPCCSKGKGTPCGQEQEIVTQKVASSQCPSSRPCWFYMVGDPSLCTILYHHHIPPRTTTPPQKPVTHTSEDRSSENIPQPQRAACMMYLVTSISSFRSHLGKVDGGGGE